MKCRYNWGVEITMFVTMGLMALVSTGCGAPSIPAVETAGDPLGSDVAIQDEYNGHILILDTDYDDSWVENIPNVIAGYEVLYINTPKNTACSNTPVIGLRARQKSLDEFLGSPPSPDVYSIVDSLLGLPRDIRLSFSHSSTPIDKEERDDRRKERNARRMEIGCPEPSHRASGSVYVEVVDPDYIEPVQLGPTDSNDGQNAPQSDAGESVFDYDYDDSWVVNIPDVIGGYRVISIETPKSVSCTSEPQITFQAPQKSMKEFLKNAPDAHAMRQLIDTVQGVPPDILISFVGPASDEEEHAENLRRLNEENLERGCFTPEKLGGPIELTDEQLDEAIRSPSHEDVDSSGREDLPPYRY